MSRTESFKSDLLSWLVVSHLLSADLVAELAHALTDIGGAGSIQWNELFEEQLSGGPPHLANFLLRHKKVDGAVPRFLQSAIWTLVAFNDEVPSLFGNDFSLEDRDRLLPICYALDLARLDFTTYRALNDKYASTPEALAPLLAAYDIAANPDPGDRTGEIEKSLPEGFPKVLRAALLKHLGDLSFDQDRPRHAQTLYKHAAALLDQPAEPNWKNFQDALLWILRQSEAAALRDLEGPKSAADALTPLLKKGSLAQAPLLCVNAQYDAINAAFRSSSDFHGFDIERTQALFAPQLVPVHDLEAALGAWRDKDWRTVNRRFWAALRRQIALGSAEDIRRTRSLFALSIFDELTDKLQQDHAPNSFAMAACLFVEGGSLELATKTNWPAPLLSAYLTGELVQTLRTHADVHHGARVERRGALIALFTEWLVHLPSDKKPLAKPLLDGLILIASGDDFSLLQSQNLAGQSLEALKRVAKTRPELAKTASAAVADAIVAQIAKKEFRPAWTALETAEAYAEVFEPTDLQRCVAATLALLKPLDSNDSSWPVIRSALNLISGEPTQSLWNKVPDLGANCAEAILRFGLASGGENVRLMFSLKDVAPYLKLSIDQKQALGEVVGDLRVHANDIHSSAVTGAIAALLAAPEVSGKEGVEDALAGLQALMDSASSAPPSMGLASAYETLMQLKQDESRLRSVLNLDKQGLRDLLTPILKGLVRVWNEAAKKPALFSTRILPPATTPEATIVHNWTFVSLTFAEFLGALDIVEPALAEASKRPELHDAIEGGRAARPSENQQDLLNSDRIRADEERAFYIALGQRLAHFCAQGRDADRNALEALTEQCLKFGPNGLDAAVFALAIQASIAPDSIAVTAYRQRLAREEMLKFSLDALVERVSCARRAHTP